jgi:glycosyltransferase involved in cell wall biosynthesis
METACIRSTKRVPDQEPDLKLNVLSVAYPFAPVKPDTPGGAEQVLAMIDSGLIRKDHNSIVIASGDSRPRGILLSGPVLKGRIDEEIKREVRQEYRYLIGAALDKWDIDLVHMHGLDFETYLPPAGPPVVVTLHLPVHWYSPEALSPNRPGTFLHCVSATQRKSAPPEVALMPEIENGVQLDNFKTAITRRKYVLALGRICPEKGYHLAFDAAKLAGIPMVLAGDVFPYETHERYFSEEILPRLDGCSSRFIGPVGPVRKRMLMAEAVCLLVPSLVPETSSLAAMEALACGTPVVAFPSGALSEIVEHGRTGYLVNNIFEMAEGITAAWSLDNELCRKTAEERFSSERMLNQYLGLYRRIAQSCLQKKIVSA